MRAQTLTASLLGMNKPKQSMKVLRHWGLGCNYKEQDLLQDVGLSLKHRTCRDFRNPATPHKSLKWRNSDQIFEWNLGTPPPPDSYAVETSVES